MLTVPHLVMKFVSCYGNGSFITTFTETCHCILSQARWIQSTSWHPVSFDIYNIIFPFMRRSDRWSVSGFLTELLHAFLIVPLYATFPAHIILILFMLMLGEECALLSPLWCIFLQPSVIYSARCKYSQYSVSRHPQSVFFPEGKMPSFYIHFTFF